MIIDESNRFSPETGVLPTLSPLTVNIPDKRLLEYVCHLEKEAEAHWNKADGINLKARREQNIRYLFGKQLIGRDLKKYESEFLDNVIYEFEGMLKALAISKMPDIVVEAGGVGVSEERKLTAELLTEVFEKNIDSDQNRNDLGMMFKHLPAYFVAAKKYRWDASKDKLGDYIEDIINPSHIVLDHTCLTSNPDDMMFIIHYVEKTAKEWVMLFPDKEEQIKAEIAKAHPQIPFTEDNDAVLMAQKVRVAEVWYDWIDKAEDSIPENIKFEFMSGICWKLSKTVLLGSSKNPNWDYEGHDVPMLNNEPVPMDMMEQMMSESAMTGMAPQFEMRKVYNNYFKFPKKPFILMTFDQFLRSAIDETSRIEQTIPLQKSMDDVERQTDYMVKSHKGKHVWSKESGMTKKDLKKLDMNNPDMDIVGVGGQLPNSHLFIQPAMPPGEMFVHIRDRRERMFAKAGAHGATRGEISTPVATTNQISREADFTKNDDLVNATILHVSTESAKARLHMIKLRYTEKHFERLAGIDEGKYLHLRLTGDSIDDGMEVVVKASTTDKLRAERNAQTMASLQMIGPYYFMKALDIPDIEGHIEELYLFTNNQALWYEKFGKGKNLTQVADQVVQSTGIPGEASALPSTAPPIAPMNPTPTNTAITAVTPPAAPQGSPSILQRAMAGIRKLGGR